MFTTHDRMFKEGMIVDMKKINIKHKWIGFIVIAMCIFAIIPAFQFMSQKVTYKLENDAFWYTLNTKIPVKKGTVFSVEDEKTVTNQNIDVKGLPLYFKDEEKILLPKTYSLIYTDGTMYKVNRFSEIYRKDYRYYLKYDDTVTTLQDCFLFDGESTYLFFDKVDIKYGKTTYTLDPLSYVNVYGDGQYEIYNHKQNFYQSGKVESKKISVTLKEHYTIDMVNDVFIQPEQQILLFHTPETLPNKP